MHQPREALVVVQGVAAPGVCDKTRVTGFDLNDRSLVLVGIKIDMFGSHVRRWKIGRNSDNHSTRLIPEMAVASCLLSLCPSHVASSSLVSRTKRILPHALFGGVRVKEQHGFLLLDAREVKQIRIGARRQRAVGVGGENVVAFTTAKNWAASIWPAGASFEEQLRVDRSIAHFRDLLHARRPDVRSKPPDLVARVFIPCPRVALVCYRNRVDLSRLGEWFEIG